MHRGQALRDGLLRMKGWGASERLLIEACGTRIRDLLRRGIQMQTAFKL